jgi:hypothetical protein
MSTVSPSTTEVTRQAEAALAPPGRAGGTLICAVWQDARSATAPKRAATGIPAGRVAFDVHDPRIRAV